MGTTKGNVSTEIKVSLNFGELVSEARVKQIVEEDAAITEASSELQTLKANTHNNLCRMSLAAELGNEEERREIRNEVVVENMRLVTAVLKKYGYFNPDKFQNGCIGLLKAADTYDITKGVPFGNYAAFCIEMEIRAAFRQQSRKFEGKAAGFLDSLDAPVHAEDGQLDKHEAVGDPYSETEFDALVEDAELDTLFYSIIIPAVQDYGTRAKDLDMVKWQDLTVQYIIEMSLEDSQRQRLTLSAMAVQLGTTTQNLRVRHKKVMAAIRKRCEEYGYKTRVSPTGRTHFYLDEDAQDAKLRTNKKGKRK